MEDFIEQLSKQNILDIYDEIAEIPITDEQLVKICLKFPCKVDLRRGNIVHLVEQKYKDKLSKYSKRKILKWLKANLPRKIPDPETKYLKWQERHKDNAKAEWIRRKADALGGLPPLVSGSSDSADSDVEISCSILMLENKRRLSRFSEGELQSNSTAETLETVIPSQPKNTIESTFDSEFIGLLDASKSSVPSGDLPSICSNEDSGPNEMSPNPVESNSKTKEMPSKRKIRLSLIHGSEGFLSDEDPYGSFNMHNLVTSTQEFD